MFRVLGLSVVLTLLPGVAWSQKPETGFLNRTIADGGEVRAYQVFVPRDYTPARSWPVILFLHGGGEQGTDGFLPTEGGIAKAIRQHPDRFPAVVVFPQVRPGKRWNGQDAALALKTLEQTQREFTTDSDRVYLTGLSRGGAGAYYLAYRDPRRFAAVLISCGRVIPASTLDGQPAPDVDPVIPPSVGDPFEALAVKLKEIPLWVFHGDADMTVSVDESRRAAAALSKVGAPFTYTELPGVGHNSWDTAYGRADVTQWLFTQRRTSR